MKLCFGECKDWVLSVVVCAFECCHPEGRTPDPPFPPLFCAVLLLAVGTVCTVSGQTSEYSHFQLNAQSAFKLNPDLTVAVVDCPDRRSFYVLNGLTIVSYRTLDSSNVVLSHVTTLPSSLLSLPLLQVFYRGGVCTESHLFVYSQ